MDRTLCGFGKQIQSFVDEVNIIDAQIEEAMENINKSHNGDSANKLCGEEL